MLGFRSNNEEITKIPPLSKIRVAPGRPTIVKNSKINPLLSS